MRRATKFGQGLWLVGIASVLGLPLPAQSDASAADAAQAQAAALDQVIVTARKRSELLQQVPMSVVSLDGRAQRELGIEQVNDLARVVPGLQQGDLAISSRLSLRGVNSGDNNAFEQAVGVYVDGIYRGRMNQQRLGLFDLERIEVLKGPQVALYGNSSIGGALSAVTRRPSLQGGGEARGGYEFEYQTVRMEVAGDLPLGHDAALRLAASWRDQGRGLWPNQASGRAEPTYDQQALRLSTLWLPTDALSLGLRLESGESARDGHIFDVFKHVDGAGNPWPNSVFTGLNDGRLNIGNGAPFKYPQAFLRTELDEAAFDLQYVGEAWTLTAISGYSRYRHRHSADVDITPASLINVYQDEHYRQLSQELRLAGSRASFDWLLGLYRQDDTFRNDYLSDFNLPALVAPAFGIATATAARLLQPFARHILIDQDTAQSALFGQLDWRLSEQFSAALGLRWVSIDKGADQAVTVAGGDHVDADGALIDLRFLDPQLAPLLLANPDYLADPTGYLLPLPDGSTLAPALAPNHLVGYQIVSLGRGLPHRFSGLQRRERQPMLQASLAYQADPGSLWWLRWANGAKAGGFDFLYEGGDPDEVEYADERARVIELGWKRDWARLRLNLSAHYGRYDDLQVSVYDGGIGFTVGNAASSSARGIDLELAWQLARDWRLLGQLAWLDFRYDHFPDANCSTSERLTTGAVLCDWSGRRTPFVPEFEAALALEYQHRWRGWTLQHGLRGSYKGSHATASDDEIQTRQSGYALLDYRLQLQPAGARWQLAVVGRNLSDRQYNVFTSVIPLAPGGAFAYVRGRGRELALEWQLRF